MNKHEQPLLLVDVDGVTNAFEGWVPVGEAWYDTKGRRRQHVKAPSHMREARSNGYRLLLNPEHPAMFAQLEAYFDTVHATMWMSNVYDFAEVAGYGHDWDYIPFSDFHEPGEWRRTGAGVTNYKWPGLMAIIEDRPVVYVDDDLTPEQHAWAQRRAEAGIPTLFIQPSPSTGMTREHFQQIMEFARTFDSVSIES